MSYRSLFMIKAEINGIVLYERTIKIFQTKPANCPLWLHQRKLILYIFAL